MKFMKTLTLISVLIGGCATVPTPKTEVIPGVDFEIVRQVGISDLGSVSPWQVRRLGHIVNHYGIDIDVTIDCGNTLWSPVTVPYNKDLWFIIDPKDRSCEVTRFDSDQD
jgi:hypothetical protein